MPNPKTCFGRLLRRCAKHVTKFRLSAQAARDLRRISATGRRDHGVAASERHLAGFERLFQLLREQPFAGQERPEFARRVRSLSHRPHRILYRLEGDTVLIVRILHHAQDAPRALRGEQ
ncbi:type II toxin-antitoxin system RelE/ParE family toxin [Sphingomonas lenta]|uniref:Plasmid stabilization protein ParE n=1 Tax=Sphingomonas lenta TaxID=1141887 RepID=A0A2A2SFY6_9SPHN|nr:type II toxin-antitoxin system RelE/ParE family toxin [Sphingomonas lenta]PAX08113.1 hypothetical protein CKY28_11035 [Sphingomonas lenta]